MSSRFLLTISAALVAGTAATAATITPVVPTQSDGCYQISTAAELYGFAEIVNGNDSVPGNESACAILQNDIVVNDSLVRGWGWDPESEDSLIPWTRIKKFSGTFDGNGHVISCLFSSVSAGIFDELYASGEHSAVVKNLGIEDVYFSSNESALGNLARFVGGDGASAVQVTNVYVRSSTMRAFGRNPAMGSIIGSVGVQGVLHMKNCYSSVYLYQNGKTPNQLVGHLNGETSVVDVENCYRIKQKEDYDDYNEYYGYYGKLADTSAFYNGAVTFALREGEDGSIWGQDVGTDRYPNFSGELKNSIAARYNVSFHTFDGDTAKYFDNYVAGFSVTLPKGTSKENLIFGGWYRDAEFSGENDTAISNTTTGDLEYWARMYNRYKLTYHPNGGTRPSGSYYACGNPTAHFQDAILVKDSVDCYLGGIGESLSRSYYRDSSIFLGWYDNEELTGNPIDSITPDETGDKDFYAKWFEYKRPSIDPADSCYVISDAEELYGFSALVDGSFATGKYNEDERLASACGKLTKDIVVNKNVLKSDGTLDSARMHEFLPWNPIAFYKGYFDGQGHTISGIYMEGSGGVFYDANPRYAVKYITIRNLKVKDSFISHDYDAGGIICSHTNSTTNIEIENTHFDGTIYVRGGIAGGLVSEAHNLLIIRNSSHRGIIHAISTDVGGIVGHADEFTALVQNYNEGSIVIERPPVEGFVAIGPVGGLVGEVAGNFFIANNYNVADIETKGVYGGLIGAYYVGNMGKCLYETCRPDRSFVLNNYSKGQISGDWPSKMYDSDVTFENNFYLDGTLPEDSIGTPVQAEAFKDGTVARALHDYVLKDSAGAEVAGGVRGDNWIQGDEYPVFSADETQYLVLLYVTGHIELPSNVLFHTPGQVLPLPTPSKSGYSFAGWKWGNDIVTEIPATVSEDLSVSARWTATPSSSSVASSSSEPPVSSSSAKSSSSSVKSSSSSAKSSSSVKSSSSSSAKSSSSSAKANSSSSKGKNAIVSAAQVPQFMLTAMGRDIQVSGARVGSVYAVLDMQGRVMQAGYVNSANFNLAMDRAGTYLVRIGNQTQTVKVK